MNDSTREGELPRALHRPQRLEALARTRLLDSPADEAFDAVTRLAARLLRAPISLVTLIDEHRQFFKSAVGLPEPWASRRQTPLSHSFCQHVLAERGPFVVEDARTHPVVRGSDAIVELGVLSYAGVPLTVVGEPIGAFCVADGKPRRWRARDLEALTDLGALVSVQIERDIARAALQEALEELRRADRRKDEFLATLAHELRNPIAPIRQALHVMRQVEPGAPLARQSLEIIERQVRRMRRLIDDLLDVNRIARDALRLERRRVALADVLDLAVESSRPLIEEQGLTLEQQRPDQPVWMDADPVRLSQVLINLMNNAAKFTPAGGRVMLRARAGDGEVVLEVADTGIGISDDARERIFELFAQAPEGADTAYGGLGIGLALARRLVELHGGSLTARSEGRDRGSTFTVRLPARQRDAAAAEDPRRA